MTSRSSTRRFASDFSVFVPTLRKSTTATRSPKLGQANVGSRPGIKVTYDLLVPLFELPLVVAAAVLGISVTALKKVCRNFNVERWPFTTRGLAKYGFSVLNLQDLNPRTQEEEEAAQSATLLQETWDDSPTAPCTEIGEAQQQTSFHNNHSEHYDDGNADAGEDSDFVFEEQRSTSTQSWEEEEEEDDACRVAMLHAEPIDVLSSFQRRRADLDAENTIHWPWSGHPELSCC